MTQTHPDDDALVELALGAATAPDALSAHLRECAECRAAYDDVTRDLEVALAAAPAIETPAGFESRVLSRLASAPTPLPRRRGRAGSPRSRWPPRSASWWASPGSSASRRSSTSRPRPTPSRCAPTTVAMVGRVLPSWVDDEEVLVLRIVDGPPGMHYVCRLRLDDDSTRPAGDWVVPESGTATWITPSDPDVASIELVTDTREGLVLGEPGLKPRTPVRRSPA